MSGFDAYWDVKMLKCELKCERTERAQSQAEVAVFIDYIERRKRDISFMANYGDSRAESAIKFGEALASRISLDEAMRKIQAREAVRAMVELRGTPYSGPTRQSEQNKNET